VLSGEIVAAVAALAVVDGLMRTRAPHSVILDILCAFLDILWTSRWMSWTSFTLIDDAPEKLVDSRDN